VADILVLYYSVGGSVRRMAELVAEGIERVPGAAARLRTVPRVSANIANVNAAIPESGPPYCELGDLEECAGLLWQRGTLAGKPACVFTSTASLHGGQETTLLSMMLPLLHHGMLVIGLPYTQAELNATRAGGTPYGASHFAGLADDQPVSDDERTLCIAQGRRLAGISLKLCRA